ncbi:MAG: copper resistance protein NlpE N-terminal domain-containing protein, partial [Caldilinea sp.]
MKRTKSMLLTAIVMSCLLIFGAMAPALAAAPAQTDESGEMQVWASNIYPAADAPGMMEIVALYPNNAAELVTIYLTKGTIVETGSWETNAEGGVDVTLTGNEDMEYQQPALLRLVPTDDQLTDGIFTYRALTIVTPEEMDAMLEGAVTDMGAVAESDTEVATIGEVDSVWVSHVYPTADAAGLITVLALYANGNMEQTSIYLTKGVVTEVGEWEEDAEGAIVVTVTGTPDETYAEPNTTTYIFDGDALVDGALALTRWLTITPEDMLATADPVGTYVTNVYPAADAAGYIVVLSLYANNNAEQTTIYLTKGAVTEVGVWEIQDDGSI